MLQPESTCLVLIDIQERLLPVIHEAESLVPSIQRLIAGARLLDLPIIVTEQIPEKLGPTVASISELLPGVEPIEKASFSALGAAEFVDAIADYADYTFLIAGIESHVCVYQTVAELLDADYDVQVVADAVSSRTPRNREIALQRMLDDGAVWTSVEMCLLEMTGEAGTDLFRDMLKVVR
jgi:nicotinamidase-related amidase